MRAMFTVTGNPQAIVTQEQARLASNGGEQWWDGDRKRKYVAISLTELSRMRRRLT